MKIRVDSMDLFCSPCPTISDSEIDYLRSGKATMGGLLSIIRDDYFDYVETRSLKAALRIFRYFAEDAEPSLKASYDSEEFYMVGFNLP